MNNANPNQFANPLWTKDAVVFIMADLRWKANELEARLKSPYPLLFFYHIQQAKIQLQPIPNPNP